MPYVNCTNIDYIPALKNGETPSLHHMNLEHRLPAEVSSSEQIFNRPAADLTKTVRKSTPLITTTAAMNLRTQSLLFGYRPRANLSGNTLETGLVGGECHMSCLSLSVCLCLSLIYLSLFLSLFLSFSLALFLYSPAASMCFLLLSSPRRIPSPTL